MSWATLTPHNGGLATPYARRRGALKLDDNKICSLVNAEQVNSSAAIRPTTELLGDDEDIGHHNGDIIAESTLQVSALLNPFLREGRGIDRSDTVVSQFEDGHLITPSTFA
jgi:hypothetical protein